jgi:hypothetical protein
MGPPDFSGGMISISMRRPISLLCFNGAA